MTITTPDQYVASLPEERRPHIEKLREVIKTNLPEGYEEVISWGTIWYSIPHSIYPDGYHCKTSEPLPLIGLSNAKAHISFTHMGVYADEDLRTWWEEEYAKQCKYKLDMGKGCIRFKKMEDIPFELIGELCQKISVQDWIDMYESRVRR